MARFENQIRKVCYRAVGQAGAEAGPTVSPLLVANPMVFVGPGSVPAGASLKIREDR